MVDVLTGYRLVDGSTHTTMQAALNHCDEQMGAEMRTMLEELAVNTVYKSALRLVAEKRYDTAIHAYVKWRAEKAELERIQNKEDEEL